MNCRRLYRALEQSQSPFDALVVTSPENVAYLAGVETHTPFTIPERIAAVAVRADHEPSSIVRNLKEAQARAESTISDIRTYFEFRESPIQVTVDALGRPKGAMALGIETQHVTARYTTKFGEHLSSAQLTSCDRLLDDIRMVKKPDQIEAVERAVLDADDVIHEVFSGMRARDTEALALAANRADRYIVDLARTAVVGAPSKHQRDTFGSRRETHGELVGAVRAGVEMRELFALCKRGSEEYGCSFTGTHIGEGLEGPPRILSRELFELEATAAS